MQGFHTAFGQQTNKKKKGLRFFTFRMPQWGAADAEIKVPSGENTEL